jgi:hypothetical protein
LNYNLYILYNPINFKLTLNSKFIRFYIIWAYYYNPNIHPLVSLTTFGLLSSFYLCDYFFIMKLDLLQ